MCPPCFFLGGTTRTLGCSSSSHVTFQNRTRLQSVRDQSHAWSPTLHFGRWACTFCFGAVGFFFSVCVFVFTAAHLELLQKADKDSSMRFSILRTPRLKSRLQLGDSASYFRHHNGYYYYSDDYCQCYYYHCYCQDWVYNWGFKFAPLCLSGTFYCFLTVTYNLRLQKKKKKNQCIGNVLWAHTDCIGTNTASGDGGSNISWFLQHSALIPKHQHQVEHRLLHRKSSALWEKQWVENTRRRRTLHSSQMAQDAGSSMSYMRIQGVGKTFHHRPFVSQPCRTLGPSRGSWRRLDFLFGVRSSRLQHICVFSHQCVIVQYDGRLMLKQDWYYDLGRIFLTNVSKLLYHLHICRAYRCFMYEKSVLVIQGIYSLEIY